MANDYSETSETVQRLRRIETRLTKLAKALGVDVTQEKSSIMTTTNPSILEVGGLDVSFGDLLAFCRRSGINGIVTVMFQGRQLGSAVVFKEVEHAST